MKKQAVMLHIIKDGKILFLVRNKKNDSVHEQGKLLSIGGKVEAGESLETAVKREAKEEAGITIHSPLLRGIMYFREFSTEKHDWIAYLYTAETYEGKIIDGNEGSFVWKGIEDIPLLNVYSQDKLYLQWLQKYSFFAAEFLCEGYEMVDYKILKAV